MRGNGILQELSWNGKKYTGPGKLSLSAHMMVREAVLWGGEMETIMEYVKPELLVVAIVLYFVGMALKQSQAVKDKYIPLILGAAGILICAVLVLAVCDVHSPQTAAKAVFTAVTQGILVAGLSTYINQIIKQSAKNE